LKQEALRGLGHREEAQDGDGGVELGLEVEVPEGAPAVLHEAERRCCEGDGEDVHVGEDTLRYAKIGFTRHSIDPQKVSLA